MPGDGEPPGVVVRVEVVGSLIDVEEFCGPDGAGVKIDICVVPCGFVECFSEFGEIDSEGDQPRGLPGQSVFERDCEVVVAVPVRDCAISGDQIVWMVLLNRVACEILWSLCGRG